MDVLFIKLEDIQPSVQGCLVDLMLKKHYLKKSYMAIRHSMLWVRKLVNRVEDLEGGW